MISLELIRSVIRNPSFYGLVFATMGSVFIFFYSIYGDNDLFKEKEDGDKSISIQLSAFAPPSKDKIAEVIQKPKPKHHRKKEIKEVIEAPPKVEHSPMQVKEEERVEESVEEVKEAMEADVATTIKSQEDANADENIKILRFSEGADNPYLKAVRHAIERRHRVPDLARQRGYVGEVLMGFLIRPSGDVSRIKIIKECPYSILNKAAIKTIKKASKDFPRPPENTYIEIPIAYTLDSSR